MERLLKPNRHVDGPGYIYEQECRLRLAASFWCQSILIGGCCDDADRLDSPNGKVDWVPVVVKGATALGSPMAIFRIPKRARTHAGSFQGRG
ncbi:MAG: hypothetical protein ABF370_05410 [Verrucomicrobiales bacterium]